MEDVGDPALAASALRAVEGVDAVDVHGNELSIASPNGAGVIADVAVALNGCGVPVRSLTLRTPTLDDVFLQVTGSTLAESAVDSIDAEQGSDR